MSKKILWLTWKDRKHPLAGGAEVVNEELAKRLVIDGNDVVFLVGGFKGGNQSEIVDGYKIIRVGNRMTVYLETLKEYKKRFQGWPDLIIDETNTIPFFSPFYAKEKSILFFHMLCREIWFHQMFFPINTVGFFAESLYLRLLNRNKVITVSESTKQDLIKFGFSPRNITIISEGIELDPVKDPFKSKKFNEPTLLSLGAIRSMKQTDHIVKAFELAKQKIPSLKLLVAGGVEDSYGKEVLKKIESSPESKSITYLGKVDKSKKIELLQKSHLLCSTSIKEGWGLTITEAASQGTPALVYDTDGLRDSVKHGKAGIMSPKNDIVKFSQKIIDVFNMNGHYKDLQKTAWSLSKEINFENSYRDFKQALQNS